MMNNIYSRPMFQTPQQRSGGGIMAGVAPVNMQDGGELSLWDWFSGGEQMQAMGQEGYLGSQRMSDNLRESVFDPDDPIDQATLALMAIPGVNIAARLGAMGLKSARLIRQLNKVKKATDPLVKPAGTASTGLLLVDDEFVGDVIGGGQDIADFAGEEIEYQIDKFFNPEKYEGWEGSAEEEIPDPQGGISDVIVSETIEDVPAEEGGIADLPASILEARKMHLPTFMRKADNKELAAVTVEDLEESGFDNLTDYLNNMEFDEKSGEYVLKKARGGIARLADGGEAEKGTVLPDSLENMLSFYEIDLEEFSKLSEEDQQAYVKTYQDRLDLGNTFLDKEKSPWLSLPARNIAETADDINFYLEGIGGLGQSMLYGDTSKALGIVDPTAEAPPEDESYMDIIERLTSRTAPTEEEIDEAFLTLAPPTPPAPLETTEKILPVSDEAQDKAMPDESEEPGMFRKVLGGIGKVVSSVAGYDLPDDEYRAYVASHGRRELGESRMEVYNRELAAIQDAKSAVALRTAQAEELANPVTDMQREIEYLQTLKDSGQIPADTDIISLWSSTQRSRTGTITDAVYKQAIMDEFERLTKPGSEEETAAKATHSALQDAGKIPEDFSFDKWAVIQARKNVELIYGDNGSPAGAYKLSPEELKSLTS